MAALFNCYILLSCIFTLVFFGTALPQSGAEISRKMFDSTKQIKTLMYKMKKTERIDGEMVTQVAVVKLSRNPLKVYTRQEQPKDGLEVLYTEGSRAALINPNGFPWLNLKLDPQGNLMRKEQHHTINEAGYDHVVSILEHLFNKYESEIDALTQLQSAEWNGHPCWQITFDNPHFQYYEYQVGDKETLASIAEKFKISEYMILENNKDIDDFEDTIAGETITIPNDYSPKMILLIDKQLMVPLVMKVYDDKGLYEYYEYSDIKINPKLEPEEFTAEYAGYGF